VAVCSRLTVFAASLSNDQLGADGARVLAAALKELTALEDLLYVRGGIL
jgi:hypothetical protein